MFRIASLVLVTLSLCAGQLYQTNLSGADTESKRIKPKIFLEYDKLPAGGQCRVVLEVQVENGWHINANPSSPKNLIPTQFTIKSAQGIKLTDVKYPKHQVINIEGLGNANVYEGKIRISGVLNVPASAAGSNDQLTMEIRYQACDDKSCEPPDTITIQGKIPVVSGSDKLNKRNPEYFN
ncbi:MAG: protein-disulfide reductase DsbD N-terminal domain-containing protein [Planctomycetaceae bacterium]